jgi:hypothetical protein
VKATAPGFLPEPSRTSLLSLALRRRLFVGLFLFALLPVVRIIAALLAFLVLLRSGLFLLMGSALLRLSVLRMLLTVGRALSV